MAHHPNYSLLRGWNFINDYNGNTQDFLDLARIIHAVICQLNGPGSQILRSVFVDYYEIALNNSDLFNGMARRKTLLPPAIYPVIARALAEYIIDINLTIINPPCP